MKRSINWKTRFVALLLMFLTVISLSLGGIRAVNNSSSLQNNSYQSKSVIAKLDTTTTAVKPPVTITPEENTVEAGKSVTYAITNSDTSVALTNEMLSVVQCDDKGAMLASNTDGLSFAITGTDKVTASATASVPAGTYYFEVGVNKDNTKTYSPVYSIKVTAPANSNNNTPATTDTSNSNWIIWVVVIAAVIVCIFLYYGSKNKSKK